MSTARFTKVVEKCGRPELYLLWMKPEKDGAFQKHVKSHRIMTVHQQVAGSKKDFGEVGFHPGNTVQYLVFPRSLRAFAEQKIVGIDYTLLAELPKSATPKKLPRADSRKSTSPKSRPSAEKPPAHIAPRAKAPSKPPPASPLSSERPEPTKAVAEQSAAKAPPEKPKPPAKPRAKPRINSSAKMEIEAAIAELQENKRDAAQARLRTLLD
jgi:hypothetical protein